MIKMKKIALVAMLAVGAVGAQAATVTSITITGGDFGMGMLGSSDSGCGSGGVFGTTQCLTGGPAGTINTNDGAFEGGLGNSLTSFLFFSAPMNTFTAPTAAGAAPSTSGNPIQGTTSGSTITLDMGSFYASWNGTNFLQAPIAGTGVIPLNPLVTGAFTSTGTNTGIFDISWSSFITTAPFPGQTGYWHLTGTATTTVPVPAAAWLLGSGLVSLVGRGTSPQGLRLNLPSRVKG